MPAAVTRQYLDALRPWLESGEPNDKGELGLHCPLHNDAKRSASLNVISGDWFCHACDFGSNVEHLISLFADYDRTKTYDHTAAQEGQRSNGSTPTISEGSVGGWHAALLGNRAKLDGLVERRGLSVETLVRFQVGWNGTSHAYTIPIRNAIGEIINVRHYQLDVPEGRRKIWSIEGLGSPVLYPIAQLDDVDEIVWCEGEWDALLTIQRGFPAVTRTGSAKVWKPTWNHYFDDKVVYLCQDMDRDGQAGNRKIEVALKGHARETKIIILPYDETEDHGKDLTDFWLEGHTEVDFKELLVGTVGTKRDPAVVSREYVEVNVLDSFDAKRAGERMRMRVTITGKRNPPFLVPKEVTFTCNQSAGAKCQICPMNDLGGSAIRHIEGHDQLLLEMMNSSNNQVSDVLRRVIGAPKCPMLESEVTDFRSIEELYVRPSVDLVNNGQSGDYTNRRIVSVGHHDSLANNTVDIVGTIYPNPKTQHNEFQAWDVTKTETSIDRFEVTPEIVAQLQLFQPLARQRALQKLGEISRDLATNVTKIYGRPELHALADLTFHSILAFSFGGQLIKKGWLESLIVGDTRTGKSEVAEQLISYYGHGEMVSCESATFAGIVGGLQQYGGDKTWEVTWGAIPINDRRLVVLDEVSGLTTEQIAQMSSIRSSGEAQLTKIRSERTWARTRLLWMGNPRQGRMADYTYGVQAIAPLIGNNEDVARFDLAMSVAADEIDPAVINQNHQEQVEHRYIQEHCRNMLLWCWSRKAEHVTWGDGAQAAVYRAALDVGGRYVETPPLVQAANVRIKIARVAVALAARTFSTDASHEAVVVNTAHVEDAVKFMDMLYRMPGFGYDEISSERIKEVKEAGEQFDEAKRYLAGNKGLAKFFRSMGGHFRSNDLQDMLNMDKEMAAATINTLWNMRMISRRGPEIIINPLMHELLRDFKDY